MSRPVSKAKSGSALLMVLAVVVVLAVLITEFGASMKSEVKSAGGHYEEALNFQLARSAFALARLELARKGTALYADEYGNAFFVQNTEDYESQIEEMMLYRQGLEIGRGMASYRILHKRYALDPNDLGPNDWQRLLEVACGIEEGDERNALVDAVLDWIDTDNLARASGAEAEFYEELDQPRHVKNGPLEFPEELLLVYGFTPEMLYGYGHPVRIEDGLLAGGGLLRFFMGDHSPEGRASRQYILNGTMPSQENARREELERYRKVDPKPVELYLLAQGFVPELPADEFDTAYEEEEDPLAEPLYRSRHIILARLVYSERDDAYRIDDFMENAGAEAVERLFAFGVPGEDYDL